MKIKEVWKFSDEDKNEYLLRVVLSLKDLQIEPGSPLFFFSSAVLIQVLNAGNGMADWQTNNIVNGLFFMHERSMKKYGYERIGKVAVDYTEIEFPISLDLINGNLYFSRGEILLPLDKSRTKELYEKWDIRKSWIFPLQLPGQIQDLIKGKGKYGIPGGDLRYNPREDEVLVDLGIDVNIDEPYWQALERYNPRLLENLIKATNI